VRLIDDGTKHGRWRLGQNGLIMNIKITELLKEAKELDESFLMTDIKELEDIKGVIRIRKPKKDRQHNGHKNN
jgi:hypothetical protein